jgi:hypothetical protein
MDMAGSAPARISRDAGISSGLGMNESITGWARDASPRITRRSFVMSMSAAMAIEPTRQQLLAKSDLLRLEGLGDNCELGFVLRGMGFEAGMLFRWASIRPESLLATLRGDFEDLYEFDNLVPQNPKMVRDLHYGTAWHTQMYSSLQAGTLTFNADQQHRRAIHIREAAKLSYLVGKLREKFNHPNPVFVIKANSGISEDLLEAIHYQIYRRATSPSFLLLEVQDDVARAGTVDLVDRNRMRGYVTHFAPYDRADEGDDQNWIAVLTQALAHNVEPPTASSQTTPAETPGIVSLPFPEVRPRDLRTPVIRDLRGGMPCLIGGNGWCRTVEDDIYRLHATDVDAKATRLQWTGVYLPPGYAVTIQGALAIEESLPLRAILEISGSDGATVRSQRIFDTTREQAFSGVGPAYPANPLTISLRAEPLVPLKVGERAVIDIASVKAAPSNQ